MEGMKSEIMSMSMFQGNQRYNPENIKTLGYYVDLEANPTYDNLSVVVHFFSRSSAISHKPILSKFFQWSAIQLL